MNVVADREVDVPLPGAAGQWPFAVRSSEGPLAVLNAGGVPTVRLPKGGTDVDGQFVWDRVPDTLVLPERIALVHLEIDGRVVERPRRDPNLVWLAATQAAANTEEDVSITVFRRIEVGSPLLVRTWLQLAVSGKSRELNLGNICLAGGTPVELISDLPARFEPDHSLVVQLNAGTHDVKLLQALPGNLSLLTQPTLPAPWPAFEIWSLLPNDSLRQTRLSGAISVDPERSNVPTDWRTQASYRVESSNKIELITERRGDPSPAPNQLTIRRDLWLDMDGDGFTARDQIQATLNQGLRLDLTQGTLGHVQVDKQPQLITVSPVSGLPGVELRAASVALQADWRQEKSSGHIPAVGWSNSADSLSLSVHLPPGFELLGASGVDTMSDSWLASWDLFTLFYVLLVGLAAARIAHPAWGALGILVLVLTHNQPDAPSYVWLTILAGIALLRVLPSGFLRRLIVGFTASAAVALLALLVTFAVAQVRQALYPQVRGEFGEMMTASSPISAPMQASKRGEPSEEAGGAADSVREAYDAAKDAPEAAQAKLPTATPEPTDVTQDTDPREVVQTGPGMPDWQFRTWELGWSGPVHEQHQVRLYLLTPGVTALLAFLRVCLSGLFAILLLRLAFEQARRPARTGPPPSSAPPAGAAKVAPGAVAISLALCASGWLYARPAAAELPDSALLEELKRRVTAPAPCQPNCLAAGRAKLEVTGNRLTVRLEVAAGARGGFQLPGPAKDWTPNDVRVDGRPIAGLLLADDGFIYVHLEPGTQTLDLTGTISGTSLSLKFGASPQRLEFDSPGWELNGLREEGQVGDVITLHRRLAGTERPDALPAPLTGWLVVKRTFRLGVNWTVDTEIDRISPNTAATARIPLLPFERVTSNSIQVDEGFATVTLDRGSESASFRSTLKPQPEFTLKGTGDQRFSERWIFDCSPIWHCTFEGLDPVTRHAEGALRPEFVPDAGEQLRVAVVRPTPAPGVTLTVDAATLEVTPGLRIEQSTWRATVRASAPRALQVHLPEGAQLRQITLDGVPQPLITSSAQQVTLQLEPGEHQAELSWQREQHMGLMFRAPVVRIDAPIANARTQVSIPEGRWLLLLGGAGWGPAILFWGFLALLVLVAPALGRAPGSPLRTRQWLALTLGLTQIPTLASLVIVGWFFAFAHVGRWRSKQRGSHNFAQVLLVLFTFAFLSCLLAAVYDGLLSSPDMAVQGAGSSANQLIWYLDRTDGNLPQPWVLTTSLWVYRFAMLVWALWLVNALLGWLKWAWTQFSSDGLWLKKGGVAPPPGPTPGPRGGAPEARAPWGSIFFPRGFPEGAHSEPEPATLRREPEGPIISEAPVVSQAPPSSLIAPTHLTFPELFVVQPPQVSRVPSSDEDRVTLPHSGLVTTPPVTAPTQLPTAPPISLPSEAVTAVPDSTEPVTATPEAVAETVTPPEPTVSGEVTTVTGATAGVSESPLSAPPKAEPPKSTQ